LSCVMLDAVTLNGGSSQLSPPEKSLPATAAGGPFGVWHAESGATRTAIPAQGGQQSGDCGQQVMAA
jgi:hypothetical protein